MRATILGTANPIPTPDRAGNSIAIEADGGILLVDCGPRTVYELLKHDLSPGEIERLFFTHHHVDHNISFYHLAIVGWIAGRQEMQVFGPRGTEDFVDQLYSIWADDIAYKQSVGYPAEGIENITTQQVTDNFFHEEHGLCISSFPVEHSIETYGYRFTDSTTGETLTIASDTTSFPKLVDSVRGSDVLVLSCNIAPVGEVDTTGYVWDRYSEPYSGEMLRKLSKYHMDPTEAGRLAADADVDTLILSHFPPYTDHDEVVASAREAFEGEVAAATDGLSINFSGTNVSVKAP